MGPLLLVLLGVNLIAKTFPAPPLLPPPTPTPPPPAPWPADVIAAEDAIDAIIYDLLQPGAATGRRLNPESLKPEWDGMQLRPWLCSF